MIKILFLAACGIVFGINTNGQNHFSGLYLTQTDFENRHLTYSTADPNEKNKIRFNEIFGKPYINIRHNGEKIIIFKDDIFAYQKKGKIVRTHNFISYDFIENGVLWIYAKDFNVQLGKGIRRERKYFYSVSGREDILPLTVSNLKRSFPGKHEFHNFLEAQFRSDADLASYNKVEKKFRVNHLLETTVFVNDNIAP